MTAGLVIVIQAAPEREKAGDILPVMSLDRRKQPSFAGASMPFDGPLLIATARDVLQTAISASGLRPIDPLLLDQHKAEQIRRHPPSWLYRHSAVVQLTLPILLVSGFAAFFILFSADLYALGIGAGMMTIGVSAIPLLVPARGPAEWRERPLEDWDALPAALRSRAYRLSEQLPEVRFEIGELVQERVTLDPYLVAEYRGAREILGIWDGEELIACA